MDKLITLVVTLENLDLITKSLEFCRSEWQGIDDHAVVKELEVDFQSIKILLGDFYRIREELQENDRRFHYLAEIQDKLVGK